jgi:hypothetical protein
MSTPREELHALIDTLPESATEHIDEILRDEFGRRPA